jgi:hypothetical protein
MKKSFTLWLLQDSSKKSSFTKWNSAMHLPTSNIYAKCFSYKPPSGGSLRVSQYICTGPILSRRDHTLLHGSDSHKILKIYVLYNIKNTPRYITVLTLKPLQHMNSYFGRCLCSFVLYPLAHTKEISTSGKHKFKQPGNNTVQARKAGKH